MSRSSELFTYVNTFIMVLVRYVVNVVRFFPVGHGETLVGQEVWGWDRYLINKRLGG